LIDDKTKGGQSIYDDSGGKIKFLPLQNGSAGRDTVAFNGDTHSGGERKKRRMTEGVVLVRASLTEEVRVEQRHKLNPVSGVSQLAHRHAMPVKFPYEV